MNEEALFWADQLAEDIISRKKYNYIDKEIKNPELLTVKSSTSISGVPHIGNASDVIRHDAVVRALRDRGKKVRFIWVAEDMDALRKVPAGIPKSFEKYLGMPVADLPCPQGCCKSYAEHFSRLFVDSLTKNFSTKPEYLSTAQTYRSGEFYPWIKKIMDNISLVREIWNKSSKSPLSENWNPWKPVCENCGKLMTTEVIGRDNDAVNYVCSDYKFQKYEEDAYTSLKGCGHKGVSDIKKGNGKLLWRVEWGMLWAHWKIILEGAGKEHFMPTGSFWTAGEVCERVLNWPEPYPSENPLQPYEYLTIDSKKMSASVGNVVATWEWPDFAPPQILRLLFLKRMKKVRDFSYTKIPDYVDEYDELQKIFFGTKKLENKKEEAQLKRLYEMIEIEIPKKLPPQIPFSFAAIIAQITKPEESLDRAIKLLKATGHIEKLDESEKKIILFRLITAKHWVDKYDMDRIKINATAPDLEISKEEKKALAELKDDLEKQWNEKDLQFRIYETSKHNNIPPKRFFQLLYQIICSRDSGPRLGPFIITIGEEKVRKLLETLK